MPLREDERDFCMDVRLGKVDMQTALTKAGELEREIKDLIDVGPLRDKPDLASVEAWTVATYLYFWQRGCK